MSLSSLSASRTFHNMNLLYRSKMRTLKRRRDKEYVSRIARKPDICQCENKGADQLCSNCTADQPLCFRYKDSTITILSKSDISSF